MDYETCCFPSCPGRAIIRVYGVHERTVSERKSCCDEHISTFMSSYFARARIGPGPSQPSKEGVAFDVEMFYLDPRPNEASFVALREVGGDRMVGCEIGVQDAASLWWHVDSFQHPRPLIHSTTSSIITLLGGELDHVVVHKYAPSQKVKHEAKLIIRHAGVRRELEVRISDAIILAVVCDAPIFIAHDVNNQIFQNHVGVTRIPRQLAR